MYNFQIMESPNPPILLPIWIHQMAEVWPQSKPYYPRVGKVVNMTLQHLSYITIHITLPEFPIFF